MTAVLNMMATAARDYAAIRRRATAAQAKSRASARITIATIMGSTTLLIVAARDFLRPYDTALGQLVLLIVAAMHAFALAWMNRIVDPAPPPRILTGLDRLVDQPEKVRAL